MTNTNIATRTEIDLDDVERFLSVFADRMAQGIDAVGDKRAENVEHLRAAAALVKIYAPAFFAMDAE